MKKQLCSVLTGRIPLSLVFILLISFLSRASHGFASDQVFEEWVSELGLPGGSVKIALDIGGNPHLLAGSGAGTSIIKYDKNGSQVWVRANGFSNADAYPVAIAVDGSGNVYFTGESSGSDANPGDGCVVSYVDYATVKYDSQGNQLWIARFNGPSKGVDEPVALSVDSAGNAYVTGTSYVYSTCIHYPDHYELTYFSDFVTIKYDSDGNELWRARFNASQVNSAKALALATDGEGNAYVVGSYQDQIATIKYDSQGNQSWVRYRWGRRPALISLDGIGNAYVATVKEHRLRIYKYDSNGNLLWEASYGDFGKEGWTHLVGLAVDKDGNVCAAGNEERPDRNLKYVIIKYDSNGNKIWKANFQETEAAFLNNQAKDFTQDADGNVYITGYDGDDPAVPQGIVTVKYDSNGYERWVSKWRGASREYTLPFAIAVDDSKNVYVAGHSASSPYFGNVLIKLSQGSNDSSDGGNANSGGGAGCFVLTAASSRF